MPTAFKVYIGGNVVLIVAGIILMAVGLGSFAAAAIPLGTALWMGATVAWIVYTKVVTFDH